MRPSSLLQEELGHRRSHAQFSAKLGERILIPQFELTFSVVAIDGNTVKVGITAPTNVSVDREELWRKVRMEQGTHLALAARAP